MFIISLKSFFDIIDKSEEIINKIKIKEQVNTVEIIGKNHKK